MNQEVGFVEQVFINRKFALFRNPDTQVLRRRLRFPETITMSKAARNSTIPEVILEATDVEDIVNLIENFFLLERPSSICPRWVSRINLEVNQEAIKKELEYLEDKLKGNPEKNHIDLNRIEELKQELLIDPQQPWSMAKNNFTFRNRNNYCLYCTLRDRFLNFHQSKFSAMEQEPESTSLIELSDDRYYKERTYEMTDYSQRIIGTEELLADSENKEKKVVFTMVSEDLLYSLVSFALMLTKKNVHIVGTCSGKRFFVYDTDVYLPSEYDSVDFSSNFFVLHTDNDPFMGKAIVAIKNVQGSLFIFANPKEYPELHDSDIMELFSSIIYDYVVNGVKQEFYDDFYKQLFAFLK